MFAWKNHGRSLGRIDGWWSDSLHRVVIQREIPESWSSTFSGKLTVLKTPIRDFSSLTTPSSLSTAMLEAKDRSSDRDAFSLGWHGQCLERNEAAAGNRTGAAGLVAAAY